MNEKQFSDAIAPMLAVVNKPVSAEQMRAWFIMVGEIDPKAFAEAVIVTMRDYQFAGYPPIGTILKNAGAGGLQTADRVEIAWAAIRRGIAVVGGYKTVSFDDPFVTAAVRHMGGWERLCECEAGEPFNVWLKREFEAVYRSLLANGIDAIDARPLAGLIEISRTKCFQSVDDLPVVRIATKLPPVPATLVRDIRQPRLEGPVMELVEELSGDLGIRDEPACEISTVDETERRTAAIQRLNEWQSMKGNV